MVIPIQHSTCEKSSKIKEVQSSKLWDNKLIKKRCKGIDTYGKMRDEAQLQESLESVRDDQTDVFRELNTITSFSSKIFKNVVICK